MDFTGKIVIVTGGASGMGAACARLFASHGAAVTIVDRNELSGKKLATSLPAADCVGGDVSDSAFCDGLVSLVQSKHGRVDVLVNAAGVIARKDSLATSDDDWRRVMRINVDGLFYMSRAALRIMTEQRGGAIVNFGSIWGSAGASGVIAYCASKGAVHQITRSMALECVEDGIRINAVCPGEVNTPMLKSGRDEPVSQAMLDAIAETVPMGRLAEPEEVARVVAFLASEDASYMTGALVPVDAGYSAR